MINSWKKSFQLFHQLILFVKDVRDKKIPHTDFLKFIALLFKLYMVENWWKNITVTDEKYSVCMRLLTVKK